uniref:Uncharacterized protein n=1 Tax=Streptomyces sp. HK1 TaxID=405041 RepID=B0LU27_9ACTN|nr:unknown [Streptomyces sp. HK1]
MVDAPSLIAENLVHVIDDTVRQGKALEASGACALVGSRVTDGEQRTAGFTTGGGRWRTPAPTARRPTPALPAAAGDRGRSRD